MALALRKSDYEPVKRAPLPAPTLRVSDTLVARALWHTEQLRKIHAEWRAEMLAAAQPTRVVIRSLSGQHVSRRRGRGILAKLGLE